MRGALGVVSLLLSLLIAFSSSSSSSSSSHTHSFKTQKPQTHQQQEHISQKQNQKQVQVREDEKEKEKEEIEEEERGIQSRMKQDYGEQGEAFVTLPIHYCGLISGTFSGILVYDTVGTPPQAVRLVITTQCSWVLFFAADEDNQSMCE